MTGPHVAEANHSPIGQLATRARLGDAGPIMATPIFQANVDGRAASLAARGGQIFVDGRQDYVPWQSVAIVEPVVLECAELVDTAQRCGLRLELVPGT